LRSNLVRVALATTALLSFVMLLTACGGDDDATATPSASPTNQPSTVNATPTGPTPTRTPVNVSIEEEITVFAASSLTEAFTQIAEDYEAAFPGIGINVVFAGSQQLRTQLEQGAEADVLATADEEQMDLAASSGLVSGFRFTFARNRLVIIVPDENEAGLTEPEDLAQPGVKVVIGGENVPVGRYGREFLDAASQQSDFGGDFADAVLGNVVSEASNVREIVSAVQLGEVDAGIVYVTDVTQSVSGDVSTIEIPDDLNPEARYPIALTHLGAPKDNAQGFIEYVMSEAGQATLGLFGFAPGVP